MTPRSALLALGLAALSAAAGGQEQPAAWVLPAGDRVVVVLGSTPPGTAAMQVLRQGPADRDLVPLTAEPIRPVDDPYTAAEMMGADFEWIARRAGSPDPATVWARVSGQRPLGRALALVSHGLRTALGRTLVDLTVTPGASYRYRVVLLDASDRELARVERRITVTEAERPPQPRDVRAEPADGVVAVAWSYPAYAGGDRDRTTGFLVYRRDDDGGLERIGEGPVLRIEGMLGALDTDVINGRRYSYAVQAIDVIGAASEAVVTPAVTPKDLSPPLVPTGLAALDRPEGALLLWDLAPDVDAAGYHVYRSTAESSEPLRITERPVPAAEPRFLDAAAVRGEPLYYRVTALDDAGNESAPAGPVLLIARDAEPPPRLEGLAAAVDDRTRAVTLSWNPVEARDLDGYLVYSGPRADSLIRITRDVVAPSSQPRYVDRGYQGKGLASGASILYAISAVDRSGNESPPATVSVVVPDNEKPEPPLGLLARSTADGSVELAWQPPLARDVTAHRVYRSQGRDTARVAETPANTWVDATAAPGRRYRYHVTALDGAGNESAPSESVEVLATDLAPPEPPAGLIAVAQRGGVRLSWLPSPAADAQGYLVSAAAYDGALPRRLTERPVPALEYFHRQARAGASYSVVAVDSSGNMSAPVTAIAAAEASQGGGSGP